MVRIQIVSLIGIFNISVLTFIYYKKDNHSYYPSNFMGYKSNYNMINQFIILKYKKNLLKHTFL